MIFLVKQVQDQTKCSDVIAGDNVNSPQLISNMAQSRPAVPSLQPRPKAGPTFSNSMLTPRVTATAPQVLQASSSISRQPSPKTTAISGFDHSERATAALIRRVLCPHVHSGSTIEPVAIDKVLPPLTSSNEIDVQLYAIIAIIVKEVIQSWYGKMTPDQGFVEEVVRIVAHCTRALEGRLRSVDLAGLILDEMAELMERHILGQCRPRKKKKMSHEELPFFIFVKKKKKHQMIQRRSRT